MKRHLSILVSVTALAFLAACGGGGDSTSTDASAKLTGADTTGTTTGSDTSGTTTGGTTTGTTAGGDTSGATVTAAAIDKYVGTWIECYANNPGSGREVITISRVDATTASFSQVGTLYASSDCSGAGTADGTKTGTVVLTGTTTIGTDTVDKGTLTEGTTTEKQVFLVTATTLRTGVSPQDGGVLSADGYPTTLDATGLTRQ